MNFISMCCFNVNRPDPDEPQPKKKKLVFLILLPCKLPWQLYYHVSRNHYKMLVVFVVSLLPVVLP